MIIRITGVRITLGSTVDFVIVLNLCVEYLVKPHYHLISSNPTQFKN